MSLLFPFFANLLLFPTAIAQEDTKQPNDTVQNTQKPPSSKSEEDADPELLALFQQKKWAELNAALLEKKSTKIHIRKEYSTNSFK